MIANSALKRRQMWRRRHQDFVKMKGLREPLAVARTG
jgi:hypothetical protein